MRIYKLLKAIDLIGEAEFRVNAYSFEMSKVSLIFIVPAFRTLLTLNRISDASNATSLCLIVYLISTIMKRIIFILIIATLGISSSAQDFRKASWGDSKATVEKSEPDQAWKKDFTELYEVLSFTTSLSDMPTKANYLFVDDTLVKCIYYFTFEQLNDDDYFIDYENIGKYLQLKYGDVEKMEIWRNDQYKDDPGKHAYAISRGHYEITRQWEIEGKTIISHKLTGDLKMIFHRIVYSPLKLKD